MAATQEGKEVLPIDLGEGLVLRRSTSADAQSLAEFNAKVHSDEGVEKPDDKVWAWTYDLMAKPHPTFKTSDFTIVEEVASGRIISAMNLIPQIWTYAGIPFKVGRPELVGTLPEYRHRGLVRRQFEIIHRWSAQNGDLVQGITGIPYYYRLFGYEMAMNLGGGRAGFPTQVPRLEEGQAERFRIREASGADIPFLSHLYMEGCRRSLVSSVWDEALWRYELNGKSEKNVNRVKVCVIETQEGEACGFFTHTTFTWGDLLGIQRYEITPEISWLEATPSVIRYIEAAYQQVPADHDDKQPFGGFVFWLGEEHPVYQVIRDRLPRTRKPYAWYLRVPDITAFLQQIRPVMEKRLADSPMRLYSGEMKISFYREGLRLVFERGKLITLEAWRPEPFGHSGQAGFPPHTFLQLVFGYRTMDQLKESFVDCRTERDEHHTLLDALFPRLSSDVWFIS